MSIHGRPLDLGAVAHGLPAWIGIGPVKFCWSHIIVVPHTFHTAQILKSASSVIESVKYWTGSHQIEMKPSEWLVVIIGLVVGVVILYLSPNATPIAATLTPQPLPASETNAQLARDGQQWECLVLEDNANQVNLVCEKTDSNAPRLLRVGSEEKGP